MIDPKLNELTEPAKGGSRTSTEERVSAAKPRTGLSINDTVASDANRSDGARGVGTSGVEAGAGAGAGSSYLTPGTRGESPAPQMENGYTGVATESSTNVDYDQVSAHAYRCWQERGCPDGSAEEDWHRAERELRERRAVKKSAANA